MEALRLLWKMDFLKIKGFELIDIFALWSFMRQKREDMNEIEKAS